MIQEVILLNKEMYKYVKLESFDNDEICSIAEDFILNYRDETLNYISYCMDLCDDYEDKTQEVIFEIVKKHIANNKDYYWNKYLNKICPMSNLISASLVMPVIDEQIRWSFDIEKDCSIKINLSDGTKYNIVSDNNSYILVDEMGYMTYLSNEEELINRLNFEELACRVNLSKSNNRNLLYENILEIEDLVLITNNEKYFNLNQSDCPLVNVDDIDLKEAKVTTIQSLKDVYAYLLKNAKVINSDKITEEGFYLGVENEILLMPDLTYSEN